MSTSINIIKDESGEPSYVIINRKGHELKVTFDKERGFLFEGVKVPSMNDLLSLVFPNSPKINLEIPEPLNVVNVIGGHTILFDDFESLLKWKQTTGTVALDNTNAYNGGQCLKVTCGAANSRAEADKYFPFTPNRKISLEAIFAINDTSKLNKLRFGLHTQYAGLIDYGRISYNRLNQNWEYFNGLDDVAIPASETPNQIETLDSVGGAWFRVKFTVDFPNRRYVSAEINDKVFNLSQFVIGQGSGMVDRCNYARLTVDNVAGQEVIGYFDDVKIMEEK